MTTLVLAEHDNVRLSAQTARALTAARALGAPVHILVAGFRCDAVALAAARLDGVAKVLLADADALADRLPEVVAPLIVSLMDHHQTVMAPATAAGKSILPRVAALLDVMQVSEIIEVVAPDIFKRAIYAGNAIQTIRSTDARKVITVRGSAFAPSGNAGDAPVETVAVDPAPQPGRVIGEHRTPAERPDLASARIVVSGGRGLGSKENFEALLGALADRLGAAIGASRAAVDAGYAPNDLQVGQTGQIVAPDLYIACGISGAIQHAAGMKQSKLIVAINADADAPIFQIADYGLVGDLFALLPELTASLQPRGNLLAPQDT